MAEVEKRYARIPGENFFVTRLSDGERVHTGTREVKAAKAAGEVDGFDVREETAAPPPRDTGDAPRGRGRPRKARKPAPDADPPKKLTRKQQATEWGMLAGMASQGFATVTGRPWWALRPEQEGELGEALANALPTLPGKAVERIMFLSPWVKLAMVGGRLIGERVQLDQQYEAQRKAATRQDVPPPSGANGRANGHVTADGVVIVPVPDIPNAPRG